MPCQPILRRDVYKSMIVVQSNETFDPSITASHELLTTADLEAVINQLQSRRAVAFSSILSAILGSSS